MSQPWEHQILQINYFLNISFPLILQNDVDNVIFSRLNYNWLYVADNSNRVEMKLLWFVYHSTSSILGSSTAKEDVITQRNRGSQYNHLLQFLTQHRRYLCFANYNAYSRDCFNIWDLLLSIQPPLWNITHSFS